MIKLMHGDCLDLMRTIEAGSVDLIATDLPYGTTRLKWDSVVPLDRLWPEVRRVLKPSGVFLTTATQPYTSVLVCSNQKEYRCNWVWVKNNGTNFQNIKTQPLRYSEDVLVFSMGIHTYNPIFRRSEIIDRKFKDGAKNGDRKCNSGHIDPKWRGKSNPRILREKVNPSNVLYFPVVPRSKGTLHPTQKPVALYEYLVETYSNHGDLVLDICMGSGTTGEACINTGRNFIGIESDRRIFDVSQNRIMGHKSSSPLFDGVR